MLKVIGTALLTAFVTSMFWIWFYNFVPGAAASDSTVTAAGEKITVDPKAQPPVTLAEGIWVGPAGLAIPVQGVKPNQLSDTYTQARAGGARTHDAIDIMAAEGTPVYAAADGTVEKLFLSGGGGGITVYVRSPDQRWSYYYAHLQGYAPGLAEGQKVRRGQPIGRVGHTGNANPAGPHLHFAINRMEPGERWWQGRAINPYPLLAGKKASG
jgi:peptidoglycan LD-endopeptidase LytH